jgi:hypothetical protein
MESSDVHDDDDYENNTTLKTSIFSSFGISGVTHSSQG